jgi:hypothetical protein
MTSVAATANVLMNLAQPLSRLSTDEKNILNDPVTREQVLTRVKRQAAERNQSLTDKGLPLKDFSDRITEIENYTSQGGRSKKSRRKGKSRRRKTIRSK